MKRHIRALLFVLPFRTAAFSTRPPPTRPFGATTTTTTTTTTTSAASPSPTNPRHRTRITHQGPRRPGRWRRSVATGYGGGSGGMDDERRTTVGGGMKILGICGGIGSGKSTACRLMVDSLGCAARIDADKLAHAVYEPGSRASEEIASEFGGGVVLDCPGGGDVQIDRKKLGAIVFGDPASMSKLERIVWPRVREKIEERIVEIERERRRRLRGGGGGDDGGPAPAADNGIVVVEAALLPETDWHDLLDGLWMIRSDASEAIRRITETRGLTEEEAIARVRAQDGRRGIGDRGSGGGGGRGGGPNSDVMGDAGVVTAVIANDGSLGELEEALRRALGDPSSFRGGRGGGGGGAF